MKNRTKVKLILLIFFIIFFAFLFWFFYQPSNTPENNSKKNSDESPWSIFFGDEDIPEEQPEEKHQNTTKPAKYKWDVDIPRLRQISNIPTAGVYMDRLTKPELHKINVKNNVFNTEHAWTSDNHISEIRFVSKRDGYVYNTYTNILENKKITNTVIPKVYHADFWDKNNFIVQYLDGSGQSAQIRTYSVTLKEKTAEESLVEQILNNDKKIKINEDMLKFNGIFLPTGIETYTLHPNSKKIFYLLKDGVKTKGIVSDSLGENRRQIFSSDMHEWNIAWNAKNNILLNTKPSFKTYTLFFKLNSNTGKEQKIMQAALSGNGLPNYNFSKILYSWKDMEGKFKLSVYNLNTNRKIDTDTETLVDKCVWSKNNIDIYCAVPEDKISSYEPDRWYKGYTDFSDAIYKINSNTGNSEIIFDSFDYSNEEFDMVNLQLDDYEDYIYFIDSKTDFAWSFKLPEKFEEFVDDNNDLAVLGGGKTCSSDKILHENLKAGDRNGKYSLWAKKKITEAKILQEHMNRLGFSAGAVDGILGPQTDGAIKRMQKFLGTYQDGKVGPITRGLINNSCN